MGGILQFMPSFNTEVAIQHWAPDQTAPHRVGHKFLSHPQEISP